MSKEQQELHQASNAGGEHVILSALANVFNLCNLRNLRIIFL
jgi:hypothetical protein